MASTVNAGFGWDVHSYLRMDSLAQILTQANVHAGCRAMVVESCSGLVLGACLERMAGKGLLLGGRRSWHWTLVSVRCWLVVVVVVSTLTVSGDLAQPHPVPYHRSTSLSAQTSSRAAAYTGLFHRSVGVKCVGICVQLKRWVVS